MPSSEDEKSDSFEGALDQVGRATDAALMDRRARALYLTQGEQEEASRHLMPQELVSLDLSRLDPLLPEIMSRQATINIGTIGHVAHGKSTLVKAISGVTTVRFQSELKKNLTIKLGYANAKLFCCDNPDCPRPKRYTSRGSDSPDQFPCTHKDCGGTFQLKRHISFVDCPGHEVLMATMLSGAAVMDAALLLIAANEPCPQPQTKEHLAAFEVLGLKELIILQNKCDLVKQQVAFQHYQSILGFTYGTLAYDKPIVPISAQLRFNIDAVVGHLIHDIPVPRRVFAADPRMMIIRSFDVNHPGCIVDQLRGGVVGGSLLEGVLKVGDRIEIRPGHVMETEETREKRCLPIQSHVVSLFAEQNSLQYAVPGGLIGVGTAIDPSLTRQDNLAGCVLGHPEKLPDVFVEVRVKYRLFRQMIGVRADPKRRRQRVTAFSCGDTLMLNIGSQSTGAEVLDLDLDKELAELQLTRPVCANVGSPVAISCRHDQRWRLIGYGTIVEGRSMLNGGGS